MEGYNTVNQLFISMQGKFLLDLGDMAVIFKFNHYSIMSPKVAASINQFPLYFSSSNRERGWKPLQSCLRLLYNTFKTCFIFKTDSISSRLRNRFPVVPEISV